MEQVCRVALPAIRPLRSAGLGAMERTALHAVDAPTRRFKADFDRRPGMKQRRSSAQDPDKKYNLQS
jgi:hypothetical protein